MHVLIASDGSRDSIVAAERASELLRMADRVTLLVVVVSMPNPHQTEFASSVYETGEQDHLWHSEYVHLVEAIDRIGPKLTLAPFEKRIEVGSPAHTICEVAREANADVIVLGSHGRTGLGRILIGSVSEHVVRHAPCPVLVVRK
jgi:nucleotide-binding universal stress UspA family protein